MTTAVCLVLASLTAYSLSRITLRFKPGLQFLLLLASLFPQIIFLIPLYELFAKCNLINRPLALLFPYVAFSLPLAIWMMAGFFRTIPREIEEQAMVDGFSRLKILRKIILPLSYPALATCAILIFIGPFAWNEFLFALSFMINDTSKTVPVGIALLSGTSMYEIPWNQICAACVLTTLPLVIFVILFQRRIIEGLTRGALKG
jgi:ABC-type glycerol-3-phosphate transport system permease component